MDNIVEKVSYIRHFLDTLGIILVLFLIVFAIGVVVYDKMKNK